MLRNPVLPGFNPDPSFCRKGEDYYLATSTFEWYPGVQIFHSRDLANWTLVARPLNRAALLDMRGNPDSCGIWAPCLSYADGRFWLVYTDVKRYDGNFKDAHNYITTCDTVEGAWSDPWYVNSSGFDPSLFHDDGRKWFVNMRWNHRSPGTGGNPAHDSFDGILLQEWSPEKGLTGPVTNIYAGTTLGLTEAPHLFKRNGWYYLTTAEGGTGFDHAVTYARSRELHGPFETHPQNYLMTAKDDPEAPIQRTGHGQYLETHWGAQYHSFLMGRPIPGPDGKGRFCPLGRETGLERIVWRDDWPWLEAGGLRVRSEVPTPGAVRRAPRREVTYDFAGPDLPLDFQWLRTPHPERIFRVSKGLTLIGREGIGSWFEQSLVARRQEDFAYEAEARLDHFDPVSYQQNAGLTTYYNRFKHHALMVSHEPGIGRALVLMSCAGDFPDARVSFPLPEPVPVAPGPVELRVRVDHAEQRFSWRQDGPWQPIGPVLDASVISDEGGRGAHGSFTGAFVGMAAFDTSGEAAEAHFGRFTYRPLAAERRQR
ncbi:glycoside hydrolase family 43 protein [Roseivivax sp. GX 12232]|uniref:glycoside hydrolase family 43 protein n=1 Tax=Roseivivax sp. GX 12232 TaxID=2900547 RepID=UPI001E54D08A|nr:glycoside hydrolase family 43 protein [Roseivivax sp. GX 12232]MCE0504117.1 glycoside hydrolase family 43 protein [Roseivivax sp. GX 12232]